MAADTGSGPPNGGAGWIRSGNVTSNSVIAGFGNCLTWTSNLVGDSGTIVTMTGVGWNSAPTLVSPWSAYASTCNMPRPVWCVEN